MSISHPMARSWRGRLAATLVSLAAAAPMVASAHTAWFESDPAGAGRFVLLFGGHEGKTEPYPPEKVISVAALDERGQAIDAQRLFGPQGLVLAPARRASLLTVHFDNGIHTRGPDGKSVPSPMNAVPGATRGVRAIKYGKTVLRWSSTAVLQPAGQPMEIVPLEAPRAGQPMRLRVLRDGRPAVDIAVARDEGVEGAPKTNEQGEVSFTPQPGWNKVWAGQRTPVADNPAFNELSIEVLLVFEAGR